MYTHPLLLLLLAAPTPDAAEQKLVKQVNGYRKLVGLPAVSLDDELSAGCRAHAAYLAGLGAKELFKGNLHDEDPGKPGYSEEGRRAARRSLVYFYSGGEGDPVGGGWMASLYHRTPLLDPALKRVGVGHARKGDLRCVALDAQGGRAPGAGRDGLGAVAYPADGQKGVLPGLVLREFPDPLPPEGRGQKVGVPVTVTFYSRPRVRGVEAALKDDRGEPVAFWLSSPEKPARKELPDNHHTVCLIPKASLRPGTTYTVRVTATVDGKEWERAWSFTTGR